MTHRILTHPLTHLYAAVVILFAVFWVLPESIKDITDAVLAASLVIGFGRAMIVMLQRTEVWTHRGLGFLGTITGDMMLYATVLAGIAFGASWHLLDLARAFLAVGVVLLWIGLGRIRWSRPAPPTSDD